MYKRQVLKSYTNFSDAQLIEHLNGNIHYQLVCGVQIDPLHPLTNPKIVSADVYKRQGEMYILYLVRVVPHIEVHFRLSLIHISFL